MKKSSLETIVLILGIGIIGFALFMYLVGTGEEGSAFYTNIVFSFGFLIYIVYSMMATKNLNKEIQGLTKHVKSLKDTILEKNNSIEKLQNKEVELIEQNGALNKALADSQDSLASLHKKVKELEELQASTKGPEAEADTEV